MRQPGVRATLLLLLPQDEDVRQELAVRLERVRGLQKSEWGLPITVSFNPKNAEHLPH